ncbi:OsmC family protein [Wukongibacter sp. M2B1]|uniref:OsmC family protein n=1 Tax=Wukongibacter sp. M2B1 TaxID=3088895 RepID=UPI003D78DC37
MNNNQMEVDVKLTNQKVQFTGRLKSNPDYPIVFDYLPPLGDGEGYKGLELLLMSFAGCVSTTIVYLLRKMGKNISGFKINAKGINTTQPLSLQKIFIEVILESTDIRDSDIQNVIKQAEELSPVWVALKNNVDVSMEYRVIALQ